jgi:hypothetical protein
MTSFGGKKIFLNRLTYARRSIFQISLKSFLSSNKQYTTSTTTIPSLSSKIHAT